MEKIVRGDAEAALNEKIERGLPRGAKIEECATAEAVEVPQKFLQTVGDAVRMAGLPPLPPQPSLNLDAAPHCQQMARDERHSGWPGHPLRFLICSEAP